MLTSFLKLYNQFVTKYPLSIQCLQTGILVGSGDALCQSIVENTSVMDFSPRRALEFFGVGTFVIGPPKVLWLSTLSKNIKGKTRSYVALKKVFLDQIIFAPFGLLLFLVSLAVVQGKSPTEIKLILAKDYPEILKANYRVWPVIQFINFYFVPLHLQVIFIQTVAIIWNTYLSWRIHLEVDVSAKTKM